MVKNPEKGGLSSVRPYEGNLTGLTRLLKVDDALIRRASEIESRVFQSVDEGAVNEDVTLIEECLFLGIL